jgi:hypothetical protein
VINILELDHQSRVALTDCTNVSFIIGNDSTGTPSDGNFVEAVLERCIMGAETILQGELNWKVSANNCIFNDGGIAVGDDAAPGSVKRNVSMTNCTMNGGVYFLRIYGGDIYNAITMSDNYIATGTGLFAAAPSAVSIDRLIWTNNILEAAATPVNIDTSAINSLFVMTSTNDQLSNWTTGTITAQVGIDNGTAL